MNRWTRYTIVGVSVLIVGWVGFGRVLGHTAPTPSGSRISRRMNTPNTKPGFCFIFDNPVHNVPSRL